MSCSTPEQIAAAAAGEDPETLAHAAACSACGKLLEEQRAMRGLLALLAPVPLTRARRDELTAEVLARSDELPRHRRGRRVVYASFAVVAAAAAIVLVLAVRAQTGQRGETRTAGAMSGAPADNRTPDNRTPDNRTPDSRTPDSRTPPPDVPDISDVPAPDVRNPDVRHPDKIAASERVTRTRPATVVASTTGETPQFVRALQAGRDIVDLVDGAITIDARDAAPVHVVATRAAGEGAAEPAVGVRVVKGKIAVKARGGVIQSVTVFAGSAEITSAGRRQVIEAGTVWDAARDGAGDPGLGAFRAGWTALRAGDYATAIAAFDRATAPSIAEDAAYWAAIAAERLGDRTEAARRFTAFLTSFPQSARAPAARLAREKLQR